MTREERLEEMIYHAHERGYYEQLMKKTKEMEMYNPKMNFYDRWEKAYYETKLKFYETEPNQ
jgi:phage antirepressor YoqD-like protein